MDTVLRNSSGIYLVPEKTRLFSERKLYIEGEITSAAAMEFSRQLQLLNIEDCEKCICVYINSEGGEVNSGLLMYDAIQGSKAPVKTYVMEKAYSMAAVIAACADGGRYILPHSAMLIHEPLIGHIAGSSSCVKEISARLLGTAQELNKILSKHTKRSLEDIEKAVSSDNFMDAEACVKFGLVDEIVSFDSFI